MELRQLRSLVALAEESHFTRAAQRLHIAQPALSQQIAKLEREVGVPLVDRTTRRVALTEAGELLLAHARRMISEETVALAELDELAGLRRGHLNVGAAQAMGPVDLAKLLVGFHRSYPAVELTVREALSVDLNVAVLADELDLAFVTGVADPARIESHQVALEDLVCILSPAHPLTGADEVSLADLADETFVMFAGSATIRGIVQRAAGEHGYAPQIGFETSDVNRIRALVGAGLGVAILPRSDAEARGPRVAHRPLTDAGLVHAVHVCWRRGRRHSPAAKALVELALREAGTVAAT
ncbi:MAG: transcriptional regulator, LysR family [Solirubrobacterales bacterium]|nr:transcriptional regulator, LysR family [Solirubrobacterales bacterium]